MNAILALGISVAMLFAAAWWLMLFFGVLHGVAVAVPAISYGTSVVLTLLYGGFHNAATWPGAGHKVEDL